MAHEIGRMFYFGDVPWHGLGAEIRQPATLDEALAHGDLDWEAALAPLATAEDPPSRASQRRAIVRSDRKPGEPGRVLGVVHAGFRPLQNRAGMELFDRLFDPGARKYHTGGWLRNGELVWLLARLDGDIVVDGDDVVEPYLLYSNSHDGSHAIDIRITAVRVVCRNTLSFALNRRPLDRVLHRRHRDGPESLESDARRAFAGIRARLDDIRHALQRLAAMPLDDTAFAHFLRYVLPDPPFPHTTDAPAALKAYDTRLANLALARARIRRVRTDGIPERGIPPEPPTWWGGVNAVTAWVDHVQPVRGDRYAHALLGGGDRFKSRVYAAAMGWAEGGVVSIGGARRVFAPVHAA